MATKDLEGAVALVTGASSGIGEATARHLAGRGARVALVARRGGRFETLAGEIREDGGEALVIEADVTDRAAAEGAVERTASELGRIDVVINNAGVMLLGPIADAPIEEWETMVNVNVLGLLDAAEGERGCSDLVNISSVAGRQVRMGSGVYNATKHAVGAFAESLRQEVTERRVRVSLVEPGAVATELSSHNRPEVLETIKKRFTDMERLGADDIADAITYVVTRPARVAVNEVLIRPTDQVQ